MAWRWLCLHPSPEIQWVRRRGLPPTTPTCYWWVTGSQPRRRRCDCRCRCATVLRRCRHSSNHLRARLSTCRLQLFHLHRRNDLPPGIWSGTVGVLRWASWTARHSGNACWTCVPGRRLRHTTRPRGRPEHRQLDRSARLVLTDSSIA